MNFPADREKSGDDLHLSRTLVFRRMPEPLSSESYRRWFYSRWGRDNAIVNARTRLAEYPTFTQTPSIKCARYGVEHYLFARRRVAVDDSAYLMLNAGEYGSSIRASKEVQSFTIFFAPRLIHDVRAGLTANPDALLADPASASRAVSAIHFGEHLRPHDDVVSPLLRRVEAESRLGCVDDDWYEEQFTALLRAMMLAEGETRRAIARLPAIKDSTRREMFRRLSLARDYLHENYRRDVSNPQLAREACLSPFHLINFFKAAFGQSPHQYLIRLRIEAAMRLLALGHTSVLEVAEAVGFADRTSFFRNFRRRVGVSPRAFLHTRRNAAATPFETLQ